jgi:hypothetical protein
MPIPLDAPEVLNREFLPIRAKLLEIGAALDRIDRADGSISDDYRIQQVQAALAILSDGDASRAERLQMVFSLPYHGDWKQTFELNGRQ